MEPARIIEDIYEVASVVLSDDSIVRTMATPHAVGRCPLSAGLLSFILCEKYAYHSSINTVKKKLRHMGAGLMPVVCLLKLMKVRSLLVGM